MRQNRPNAQNMPTKRSVIFPPSHIAHDLPIHVRICMRGPSVAPLNECAWRTNGIWFVTSPRARNGTNSRGFCFVASLSDAASVRVRFFGRATCSSRLFVTMSVPSKMQLQLEKFWRSAQVIDAETRERASQPQPSAWSLDDAYATDASAFSCDST